MPNRVSASARKGFTLIELLIVVAIIAILAAIAVPNFLEAQTRAKVTRAKSDHRAISVGLESYHVDNNGYPWQNTSSRSLNPPSQGLNVAGGYAPTLERLTTPISYLTSAGVFADPFPASFAYQGATLETVVEIGSYAVSDRQSYQSYWYMARLLNASNWGDNPIEKPTWWLLASSGPDLFQHNMGTFFNSASVALKTDETTIGLTQKMIYDPTNGTISRGSIWRQGGVPTGTGLAFGKAVERAN